jgi:1,4-dihydroxy-2-naphthoate octaprenyltransferase
VPKIWQRLGAWLALSRLPFHSVGLLPFILGSILAWQQEGLFRWDILLWGTCGVVLVMLATYYAGEYWDHVEDALSAELGPSRFAGGSGVVQRGLLPRHAPLVASIVSLVAALGTALVLQFGYRTGPWTVPFCILGLLGGYLYSTRPVRWVSTGLGELWIALCYGWLPVAVACYVQTGRIPALVHWLALPIGLSIFNVILLNEFPDYQADLSAGKTNLTVRLGRAWSARIYGLLSLFSWMTMFLSLRAGVPVRAAWLFLPVLALSLVLVLLVLHGRWQDRETLEKLCGANILVNLGTTTVYIIAFVSV